MQDRAAFPSFAASDEQRVATSRLSLGRREHSSLTAAQSSGDLSPALAALAWKVSVQGHSVQSHLLQLGPDLQPGHPPAFGVVIEAPSHTAHPQNALGPLMRLIPEALALNGHAIKPNKAQGAPWGAHRDAHSNWQQASGSPGAKDYVLAAGRATEGSRPQGRPDGIT